MEIAESLKQRIIVKNTTNSNFLNNLSLQPDGVNLF